MVTWLCDLSDGETFPLPALEPGGFRQPHGQFGGVGILGRVKEQLLTFASTDLLGSRLSPFPPWVALYTASRGACLLVGQLFPVLWMPKWFQEWARGWYPPGLTAWGFSAPCSAPSKQRLEEAGCP